MPTTDIVRINTPEDAIEAMRGNLVVTVEDPEVVAAQIMERILSATDAADVLGNSGTVPAAEMVDRPFTLNAVHFMKSSFDAGLPVFAVMNGTTLDDGQTVNITSSARNIAAAAAKLWQLGALPIDVIVRKSAKQTARGYDVFWLDAA